MPKNVNYRVKYWRWINEHAYLDGYRAAINDAENLMFEKKCTRTAALKTMRDISQASDPEKLRDRAADALVA